MRSLATVRSLTFIAISLPVPAVVACGDDDAPAFRDAAIWLAEVTGGKVHWLPGRHACAIEKSAEVRRSAATTPD